MTKQDLIDMTWDEHRSEATKRLVANIINTALDVIVAQTAMGDEKVALAGFGTFEARFRKARKAHNLHTGEELIVPAKTIPFFRPAQAFKDAVKK